MTSSIPRRLRLLLPSKRLYNLQTRRRKTLRLRHQIEMLHSSLQRIQILIWVISLLVLCAYSLPPGTLGARLMLPSTLGLCFWVMLVLRRRLITITFLEEIYGSVFRSMATLSTMARLCVPIIHSLYRMIFILTSLLLVVML